MALKIPFLVLCHWRQVVSGFIYPLFCALTDRAIQAFTNHIIHVLTKWLNCVSGVLKGKENSYFSFYVSFATLTTQSLNALRGGCYTLLKILA